MLAWRFLPTSRKIRHIKEPVLPGSTLYANGSLGTNGLYAYNSILDALTYSSGPIICRVRMHGETMHHIYEVSAKAMECLWMYDATEALQTFAALRALSVGYLWNMPDNVQAFLKHGGDDAARRTVLAAIRAATRSTTKDNILTSARYCSLDATRAAIRAVNKSVVLQASWDASKEASYAVAFATALGVHDEAAFYAAWGSGWDTAQDASKSELERVILMHKPTL